MEFLFQNRGLNGGFIGVKGEFSLGKNCTNCCRFWFRLWFWIRVWIRVRIWIQISRYEGLGEIVLGFEEIANNSFFHFLGNK